MKTPRMKTEKFTSILVNCLFAALFQLLWGWFVTLTPGESGIIFLIFYTCFTAMDYVRELNAKLTLSNNLSARILETLGDVDFVEEEFEEAGVERGEDDLVL